MITQELLEKFFCNECTSEEKERITLYLQEHPEALEKYLDEEDWENFKPAGDLPSFVSEKLFGRVLREQQKNYFSKTVFKRLAAAACLVLLLGAGWKLYTLRRQGSPSLAANTVTPVNADSLQHTWNATGEKMTIALKDGSLIELYPESGISYNKDQDGPERAVYLKGKAGFKVAKDTKRPFIVYSDEIATTVLGTSFTVTSFEQDNTIKVGLREGKVLVKAANPQFLKLSGNLYLSPGDLLVYNKTNRTARILTPHTVLPGIAIKGNGANLPEWYMFRDQSLDQVFDQLSLYYGVEIDYLPSDTRNRYFTGRYENKDTLAGILKDIALLNGLSLSRQNERFIVKKKNH